MTAIPSILFVLLELLIALSLLKYCMSNSFGRKVLLMVSRFFLRSSKMFIAAELNYLLL
jgi:hypothetical protein